MEHDNNFDGARGDSCAETSRAWHLCYTLGLPMPFDLKPPVFRTDKFYVRHPEIRADWREQDTSVDQILPLYLCYRLMNPMLAGEMKSRLKANWYRLQNGQPISPGMYGIVQNNQWLINQTLAVQAFIFKSGWGKTADVLNWLHMSHYAFPWVRNMVKKEFLKSEIRKYYSVEPNVDWLIDIYDKFIDANFVF
jgi:hypothetical protein